MPRTPPHAPSVWARRAAGVGLVALMACTVDTTSVCALPPCGLPQVQVGLSLVGFPPGRVDRSAPVAGLFRGTFRVGDSVALYLIRSLGPGAVPADTVRTGVV